MVQYQLWEYAFASKVVEQLKQKTFFDNWKLKKLSEPEYNWKQHTNLGKCYFTLAMDSLNSRKALQTGSF